VIVLDTNVLSALMGDAPDGVVARWLDTEPRSSIWTTAVTVFEIELGLQTMSAGRRQEALRRDFQRCFQEILQGRVLDFNASAAKETAVIASRRRREGRVDELRDSMIAGIAIAHRATLATRNARHFADLPVPVVDPWRR